jgi:high-affinity Fe2+/Pb2+ permease
VFKQRLIEAGKNVLSVVIGVVLCVGILIGIGLLVNAYPLIGKIFFWILGVIFGLIILFILWAFIEWMFIEPYKHYKRQKELQK